MKMTQMVLLAAVVGCGFQFAQLAEAAPADFNGQFEVVKTDCAQFSFYAGQQATVQADDQGISIGTMFATGDGGPGSQPYLQPVFSYITGTQRENCLGDCYALYNGAFSPDGKKFVDNRLFAITLSAPPTPAGDTVFTLNGDVLTIETSDNGQATAGPVLTCEFKRVK